MMIEAIAAGLVGVALLWLVVQPILAPSGAAPVEVDLPDPEETPRGQALLALKEIEFDRATGKLSETDYAALNAKYTAAAVAALDAPATSSARCLTHGSRAEPGAVFCPECGAGLVRDAGECAACGTMAPVDAAFCPGCGVRLR